jgi:hypothetical protein
MKNKLQNIKQTWTYNHKLLIITLALALAHVYPVYIAPHLPTMPTYAATIEWQAPTMVVSTSTLAGQVETRAQELYKENQAYDLEKYRHAAIKEINQELQNMVYTSPYVDYDALKEVHGY